MSASPRQRLPVQITLELEPDIAAALCRLCEKFGHYDGDQYLYGHVSEAIRAQQRYHMVYATTAVHKALLEVGVSGWPWVECGSART